MRLAPREFFPASCKKYQGDVFETGDFHSQKKTEIPHAPVRVEDFTRGASGNF